MPSTPHWALPYPAGSDNPQIHVAIQNLATALDDVTKYSQGLWANRPVSTPGSPGIAGRFYYATDNGSLSYDFGTGWIVLVGAQSGTSLPASPVNGQIFFLRIGSGATADIIRLVFDSNINKWVSESLLSLPMVKLAGMSSTSGVYLSKDGAPAGFVEGYAAMYSAGLRPQFRLIGYGFGSFNMAPELVGYDTGSDVAGTFLAAADANALAWLPSATIMKSTGWIQPTVSAPGTEDHAYLQPKFKVASSSTLIHGQLDLRMVM